MMRTRDRIPALCKHCGDKPSGMLRCETEEWVVYCSTPDCPAQGKAHNVRDWNDYHDREDSDEHI